MNWALEAIEKAAMERARLEIAALGGATVYGMTLPTVAALRGFVIEVTGSYPEQFSSPKEMLFRLRERLK